MSDEDWMADIEKHLHVKAKSPTGRFGWYLRYARIKHLFGIHTNFPTQSYNPDTGSLRFVGMRCPFCKP